MRTTALISALALSVTAHGTPAKEPAPDDLPKVASTFTGAKKKLYDEVYADRRISFYCGCRYDARRSVDLASCGLESLADRPRARGAAATSLLSAPSQRAAKGG